MVAGGTKDLAACPSVPGRMSVPAHGPQTPAGPRGSREGTGLLVGSIPVARHSPTGFWASRERSSTDNDQRSRSSWAFQCRFMSAPRR